MAPTVETYQAMRGTPFLVAATFAARSATSDGLTRPDS